MSSIQEFRAFAEECIPQLAQAFRDHDFEKTCSFFLVVVLAFTKWPIEKRLEAAAPHTT